MRMFTHNSVQVRQIIVRESAFRVIPISQIVKVTKIDRMQVPTTDWGRVIVYQIPYRGG